MDLSVFAVVVSRYLIGLVFLIAGLSKVLPRNIPDLHHTIEAFGVPSWLTGATTRALPIIEIASGVALLGGLMMPIPALVAAGLLMGFAGIMSLNLIRGDRPSCSCLGSLGSRPINWTKVMADGLLATIALVATGAITGLEWQWPLALAPGSAEVTGADLAASALISIGFFILARLLFTVLNDLVSSPAKLEAPVHNPSSQQSLAARLSGGSPTSTRVPGA